MPSKFRKAIYVVKDQTSIGIAKVSASAGGPNANSLEVAVLKATTHDDVPLDHRYVSEILLLIATNKSNAAACAHSIAKRITKTRNWIVALKSLNLVLQIFQDGDPYFPREVLHAMKRGAKILNLSNFRDDSNSSPWDYTAFVRTFALYLDERLDCFLTGKLQKRFTQRKIESYHGTTRRINEPIRDMKPTMLIDRITYWQKLLDRAIATRPTGPAKGNRLVQHSLHAVVQESFDLYRDISDGLALLLDSFFHLQYQSCVNAFQACVKAAKQFEELGSFYDLCKSIGVGRTSEYPSVQQPSDELIETLQEFLKDQASFPCHGNRSPSMQVFLTEPTTKDLTSEGKLSDDLEQSESSDKNSERGSDYNSLGDIMSATGSWTSPGNSLEQDSESYFDKQSDFASEWNLSPNFASFEDNAEPQFGAAPTVMTGAQSMRLRDWELVLAESATDPPHEWPDFFAPSIGDDLFGKSLSPQHHHNNPFLQDSEDLFTVPPTFKAETEIAPTFRAKNFNETVSGVAPTFRAETATYCDKNGMIFDDWGQNETNSMQRKEINVIGFGFMGIENDPFASNNHNLVGNDRSLNQESLLEQQKLWKEQQNKIIAKLLV